MNPRRSPRRGVETASRSWFALSELSGLPGLPGTSRGVGRLAIREGWTCRERVGRGGGKEYSIHCLPAEAQTALLRKSVAEVSARQEELLPAILPAKSRQELAPANNELTDRQRAVCDARLLIVKALEKVMKQGQFTRTKACTFLMQALYDGDLSEQVVLALAIGNDRNGFKFDVNLISGCRSVVPTPGQDTAKAANSITVKTLSRWLTLYIESDRNLNVLAPKTSRVRDMSVKPWMPLFLAEMQRPQSPSLARSYHNMLKVLPADVKVPSYAAVRRWYKEKYSTLDQQRGRNQGSALNPFKFCHTRTSEGMLPMDEIPPTAGTRSSPCRIRCLANTSRSRCGTPATLRPVLSFLRSLVCRKTPWSFLAICTTQSKSAASLWPGKPTTPAASKTARSNWIMRSASRLAWDFRLFITSRATVRPTALLRSSTSTWKLARKTWRRTKVKTWTRSHKSKSIASHKTC